MNLPALSPAALDTTLLTGFRFGCRPGCGLCCYASPAVNRGERERLLQIDTALDFEDEPGGEFALLATRPDGGACELLLDNRCRAHAARPFPCRSFPVHGHVGVRFQATLVLSCPGLDLAPLSGWGTPDALAGGPVGLESELAAVAAESASAPLLSWESEAADAERRLFRRSRRGDGGETPDAVRARIRAEPPALDPTQELALPPPGRDAALEELPVLFDPRYGRVALRSSEEGAYELLGLREAGGSVGRLATIPLPEEVPPLEPSAHAALAGYARYLVDRDHFVWSTYQEIRSGRTGSFSDQLAANRTEALTEVVRRGAVLARFHGRTAERLTLDDLRDGIRAVDAELLDRPTMGRIL